MYMLCNDKSWQYWASIGRFEIVNWQHLKFWTRFDVQMMRQAIAYAKQAAANGEIPVGAVLAHQGQVLGAGFNCPISTHNPTAHAEIVALKHACEQLQNYRLPKDTTLYVTLEPCTMCFGALIHARVTRIVFAALEPKSGALGSQMDLSKMDFYNHSVSVSEGLLQHECSELLSDFFRQRRRQIKQQKQQKSAAA